VAIRAHYLSNSSARTITGIAVVVDVVRAFTTAAWAFERGVERIVMTDDLEDALRLKQMLPGSLALKDGEPAPGFDLTNSPAQVREHKGLTGLTLVQRTTHGTIGAVAAQRAAMLFCASFVCAGATADLVRASGQDEVHFVVTGEEGNADEDLACAEYIAALIEEPRTRPEPFTSRVPTSNAGRRVQASGDLGSPAADPRDVAMCMQANLFGFAMQASREDGLLVLRRA
jgi:2-phosphosulfolactate phosphatase